jgi:4-hydroxy-3-polyprenylbenzoate decarboxylase
LADKKLIVGISGASGVIYGVRLLQALLKTEGIKTGLIISPNAENNIEIETDVKPDDVKKLADIVYDYSDLTAQVASGSHITVGMAVIPCSMKTLSDIAYSRASNLLVRAADVTLKEGRRLVIVPRETPLHKGHLKLMVEASDNGAVILPPMPAFYHRPKTIDDIIDQTVGKVLDLFDIEHDLFTRWGQD